MTYLFHPEARQELMDGIEYYESCRPGLGLDFASEIYSTISNILSFPEAWPALGGDLRRCQTRRFPYGVIYAQDLHGILIPGVMHFHRGPDYWRNRIDYLP